MSSKQDPKSSNQISSLKKQQSQKSKKAILKQISNKAIKINTSLDAKNQTQLLKKEDGPLQLGQKQQKAELQKQKAQAIKTLKNIEKQEKQIKIMIQKSTKKLPDISGNKQNSPSLPKKQSGPSTHKTSNTSSAIQNTLTKKPASMTNENNGSTINGVKVYMSQEDVTKLKKLKLQYKKRQQQIKNKIIAHQILIQKMKTQEILSKEQKIEQEKRKRLKSIEEKKPIIEKQRWQRNERFQQENKKLKQLKQSKKLFQKMQQNFSKVQKEQKTLVNSMIKSRFGQGLVNYDQIKQHERQYLQKKQQSIQKSRSKLKSKIKQLYQDFNHLNLHKSQFYERVKNEKKQKLEEMQQNWRKRKVFSEKVHQYNDVIKENYMPKVVRPQKVEEKKKPLYNLSQVHQMGNQYMKQGGKLIDRNKSQNILSKIKQEPQVQKRKVYKNYLHENRTQSSPQKKTSSTQKVNRLEKQMKSINQIKNPKQKYEKIKILHNKIEKDLKNHMPAGGKIKLKGNNSRNSQNENQVLQIKAKLKILQGLEN